MDSYLRQIVEDEGSHSRCCSCGGTNENALSAEELAEIVGPIVREFFEPAYQTANKQVGHPLLEVLEMVFSHYPPVIEEVGHVLVMAPAGRLKHGEPPFFSADERYVRKPVDHRGIFHAWQQVEDELKHQQRFFNRSALSYFEKLFQRIDEFRDGWSQPVIVEYPAGTEIFRARALRETSSLERICLGASTELGPPPRNLARAGRMNANGVPVFYGAFAFDTCIAEMRPTLASFVVVGAFRTTQRLRILDFSVLAQSGPETEGSFFDPDYASKQEADYVLRKIHGLIARPIQPSAEASEYLITQSIAEYLGHMHQPPLDGVIFNSVQDSGGKNIVIFSHYGRGELLQNEYEKCFPITYIENSVRLFKTEDIVYRNEEIHLTIKAGRVYRNYYDEYRDDDFPYDL
jgi:hypothetical protein